MASAFPKRTFTRSELPKALRYAAYMQKQTWKAFEPIYAALGYSEVPADHVIAAVQKGVEDAAAAAGSDHERFKLFCARKAIELKRAVVIAEEDRCLHCGEPLGAPGDDGVRECPECFSLSGGPGAEAPRQE